MNNISLMYLLQLAWKRIWLLIIAMIIFAIAAFGYCKFFATKRYSAKASIIVTNGGVVNETFSEEDAANINSSDLSASNVLTNAVVELLKTGKLYDAFVEEYGEKYNITNSSAVRSMVSAERRETNNPFVDITVTSEDPQRAKDMANDLAKFSCKYVVEDYFKRAEIVPADEAKSAGLVFPRTMFTTALAGIVGVVVMFVIVFIFDSLNQSIRGEEEFTMKFDVPLIGSVPDFGDTEIVDAYYSKKGGYGSAK